MENQEKELEINLIKDISKKYLEFERLRIVLDREKAENLKSSIQNDISTVLSIYSLDFSSTESGCLTAEFLSRFCRQFIDFDSIQEIQKGVSEGREKFPTGTKLNNELKAFNAESYLFFNSKNTNGTKNIEILKFYNPIANIIINTTIERTILSGQKISKEPNFFNNDRIRYTETPKSFEVTLTK